VAANGTVRYVLRVLAGQSMTVNFAPVADNVTIQISGADGNVLVSGGAKFTTGTFPLLVTQDYFITVISSRNTPTNYTLQVTIPPLQLSTAATPTSTPRRISFAVGEMSALVNGSTFTPGQDRFVIRALAGQTMWVNLIGMPPNPAMFVIYGADGNVLISDHAGASTWTGELPSTQDYYIDVRSVGADVVPFSLRVTVFPLAPTPTPKRISFAAGGTSVTLPSVLPKNGMDRWVIRVQAGQTMTAKAIAQNGNVMLIVFGVDGDVYQTDHVGSPDFSSQMRTTQDYYIDVRAWGDTAPSYTLQITIPPK
jgi:hypothetical protein